MGMESPELLLLVETCPKGAETLITRIIHILTDKGGRKNVDIQKFKFHISTVEPVLKDLTYSLRFKTPEFIAIPSIL